ncbi:Gon7 family protein [Colletotrichum scovillei]|uniref:EKC/KEOPS complex subunit GON7 n=1 Tax=Colletotrichum scovillei TaxID=1209932 RepID=A0A9P7R3X2_9PEZI|nr:Gon7 family protein [Colletotrichum scovillei]KAF4777004.1 Gon7 family protein [Colletotrichum scovillei]KAG7047774.1 Gon7 family protein [Colletotrichum scovillei]KAG7060088.1 Gon7 family protein [Colletotrichum scovillei]KAG7067540.1 Gon7 family protein [Colletotrichum scovillei]
MADTNPTTAAPALHFSATYQSPTNEPFTFSESLPAPPSSAPGDKSAYLNALRKSINAAQEHINKELTARMEEDKAKEAAKNGGTTATKSAVDEALEEENYGEEAPPSDD